MKRFWEIGKFVEYKGYVGSIECDVEDRIYFGKLLDIEDLVNYEAKDITTLFEEYCKAIDDYIEFKGKVKRKGKKINGKKMS